MMEVAVAHTLSMNVLNQSNHLVPHPSELIGSRPTSPLVKREASLQAAAFFIHMNHSGRQSSFSEAWKKRKMTFTIVIASELPEHSVFAHNRDRRVRAPPSRRTKASQFKT